MFSTALNSLVLALLLLLPTASARATDDSKGKSSDDRVVVRVGGDELEVDGDDPDVVGDHPIVIRVGRGGFLGVRLIGITEELRSHYGAPKEAGVLVGGVEAGRPAGAAGEEDGGVIH